MKNTLIVMAFLFGIVACKNKKENINPVQPPIKLIISADSIEAKKLGVTTAQYLQLKSALQGMELQFTSDAFKQ